MGEFLHAQNLIRVFLTYVYSCPNCVCGIFMVKNKTNHTHKLKSNFSKTLSTCPSNDLNRPAVYSVVMTSALAFSKGSYFAVHTLTIRRKVAFSKSSTLKRVFEKLRFRCRFCALYLWTRLVKLPLRLFLLLSPKRPTTENTAISSQLYYSFNK